MLFGHEERTNRWDVVTKYAGLTCLIFIISVVVSIMTRMVLRIHTDMYDFNEEQVAVIASIIQGVVSALSAGIVVYQLRLGDEVEEHQSEIQESSFLFQYNQAFIANPDMNKIQMMLEAAMEGEEEFSVNTPEDRQALTNYLVYLESFAPLVINDVVSLDYADNLMAYRFFTAVNNDYIEEKHLFRYPHYYLGCFRVYRKWEDYRKRKGEDILNSKTGKQLDDWVFFEHFVNSDVDFFCLADKDGYDDKLEIVSRLLYNADPFIYPSAFGNEEYAKDVITYLIKNSISIYDKKNIYIAEWKGDPIGAMILLVDNSITEIDSEALRKKFPKLPDTFEYTCDVYFNTKKGSIDEGTIYICSLCVSQNARQRHVGKRMMGEIILDHVGKDAVLHVLCDNESAIRLYKKCGFDIVLPVRVGFSPTENKPDVFKMVRKSKKEDILATNNPDRIKIFFSETDDHY